MIYEKMRIKNYNAPNHDIWKVSAHVSKSCPICSLDCTHSRVMPIWIRSRSQKSLALSAGSLRSAWVVFQSILIPSTYSPIARKSSWLMSSPVQRKSKSSITTLNPSSFNQITFSINFGVISPKRVSIISIFTLLLSSRLKLFITFVTTIWNDGSAISAI